jgi:predicted nucleic acid-binding protein
LIILADNDIILKLAQCDLLECLPDIVGKQWNEIYVSPTAKYQLLPKSDTRKLEKCGNKETLDRLTNFLSMVKIIPQVQDMTLLSKLADFDGIDGGENFLLAAATEISNSLLITGDKKALQDNVIIFESAILLAMRQYGFAITKQKLLGSPKPDSVLRLIFRSEAAESDFVDCLVSYSREVEPLLAYKQNLPPFIKQS